MTMKTRHPKMTTKTRHPKLPDEVITALDGEHKGIQLSHTNVYIIEDSITDLRWQDSFDILPIWIVYWKKEVEVFREQFLVPGQECTRKSFPSTTVHPMLFLRRKYPVKRQTLFAEKVDVDDKDLLRLYNNDNLFLYDSL